MRNLEILGKTTAGTSFIIGTIMLSLYLYLDKKYNLISFGLYFLIIAVILNLVLFTILLVASTISAKKRVSLLKTCGIMLLNIPITILYMYIVLSIEFPVKG